MAYNSNIVLPNKGFIFFLLFFFYYNDNIIAVFSEAQGVPAMFVFGDSLVDVGNNNHLKISLFKANYHPNGIDFPGKKATGRFSNGKNAADFIAEKVGLPTSPPYLSLVSKSSKTDGASFVAGVSFASGGAGIFNGTDQIYRQSLPLIQQVEYYTKVHKKIVQLLGPNGSANHLSKSLFTVVIGSNDLFGYFGSSDRRSHFSPQDFVAQMIATLRDQTKKLYNYGARKFLMIGVGTIGCCPYERRKSASYECLEEANHWTVEYNRALKTTLEELKSELDGLKYSYFNTYQVLQMIIQNPTTYGFSEVRAACCGFGKLRAKSPCLPISPYCSNRTNHVFWDWFHPSEASARILVDFIFENSMNYSFPLNVNQLISI